MDAEARGTCVRGVCTRPYLVIGLYDCCHANMSPAGIVLCAWPASSNTCPRYVGSCRGQGCGKIPSCGTTQPGPDEVKAAAHKSEIDNQDDSCTQSQHILNKVCKYVESTTGICMCS